jgi:hypothetical protein
MSRLRNGLLECPQQTERSRSPPCGELALSTRCSHRQQAKAAIHTLQLTWTPSSRAVSRECIRARRDDVYLFTDMAVMIDGIARKAGSPP